MLRSQRQKSTPIRAESSDEELLDLRLCDLGLALDGTALERRIERLRGEIASRGLRFQPHVWLSTEWFSPDGVPGFALPFYLAHPRLERLERSQMQEVEGRSEREFMRLARHEAGHALSTAYRLHHRSRWRTTFGRYSEPYRSTWRPDPRSRDHVRNLDGFYAQSHPAEDFSETFAVWLQPGSNWRARYAGWNALEKLAFVAGEMERVARTPPAIRTREQPEALSELKLTLRDHYQKKRKRYSSSGKAPEDELLLGVFDHPNPAVNARPLAAAYLARNRRAIRAAAMRASGADSYAIDQVLRRLIARARALDLRVPRRRRGLERITTLLTLEAFESGHMRLFEFRR